MGGVVKKLVGGSTKKESSTQTSNNTQSSFLMNVPDYAKAVKNATGSIANINIPDYQLAGMPQEEQDALKGLMGGEDYSLYDNAQKYMSGQANNLIGQGTKNTTGATDILSKLQNLSQSDYQGMFDSEYNGDLVNSQIAQAKSEIQDTLLSNLHGIDQSASMSGNMGSSRAGVMGGVAIGQAAKAVGSATVQYQTAEEQAAQDRVMSYLNLKTSTAGQLATIGQNQLSTGLNAYGQGVNYGGQYIAGQLQNKSNSVNAGNIIRNYSQQQLDVDRQNSLINSSPSLARLAYANQTFLPIANLSQVSNGTATVSQNVSQPGMLGSLMSMGGMVAGYYGGGGSSVSTEQQGNNMMMGGVIGGMAGKAASLF